MKYTYIAYTAEQDKNKYATVEKRTGEYCLGYVSGVLRVSSSDNLLSKLAEIGGLIHANAYHSKKEAEEVARFWNDCYKQNDTYLFA